MRLSRVTPLLFALAACSDPSGPSSPGRRITELPRALSTSERSVVDASNGFGFALLRELDRTRADSNIFMSPLSASMALGMTMSGADGATFDEMRSTLGFGSLPPSEIDASYRSLISLLRGLDPTVDFRIANSIWYRDGFPFSASFLDDARTYFDARVAGIDFSAPSAPTTINSWVADATNGRIDRMIDGAIPSDVVMYLINAIYFNGAWTTRFDRARTTPEPFTTVDGTTSSMAMMQLTDTVRVLESDAAQVLELPYGGGAFAMTILMPRPGRSIGDAVASLSAASWAAAIAGARAQRVEVHLPKFTLRWEATLNDELQALGMRLPFDPRRADFGRMAAVEPGDLYVSKVLQRSYVDVHEEGTEAAAVTSVEITVTCACGPPVIRVDHPFVFALRERLSGTILFLGKIVRPPA